MGDLLITVDVEAVSIEELRPKIDSAFERHLPSGVLDRRWDGEVLRVSGPGAEGSIALEDGRLAVRARLTAPASLMRPLLERKVRQVLLEVSGSAR